MSYCPSCSASLVSEPGGMRGNPGTTFCCKRCGWNLITLATWRKLTPFRQGYLLYMQGAWPTSEIMDQQNPYAEGSDEWGAFRQGDLDGPNSTYIRACLGQGKKACRIVADRY